MEGKGEMRTGIGLSVGRSFQCDPVPFTGVPVASQEQGAIGRVLQLHSDLVGELAAVVDQLRDRLTLVTVAQALNPSSKEMKSEKAVECCELAARISGESMRLTGSILMIRSILNRLEL